MAKAHAKGAARPNQPETHPSSQVEELTPGVIPLTGRYTAERWAIPYKCDPATIRRWVRKYKIPHKAPGNEMVIEAQDFWAALPYASTEEPKNKHGGNRRKKET